MNTSDPIFAAIEAHRAAWAVYSSELDATAGARFMSKLETRCRAARKHFQDVGTAGFLAAEIATMDGLTAFTSYVMSYATPGGRPTLRCSRMVGSRRCARPGRDHPGA